MEGRGEMIMVTDTSKAKGRFALMAACLLAFVALCLSLILLTGCSQSSTKADAIPDVALGSQNSGFVVEDSSTVNVDIKD
jgi:uncharacterized lipoprotein YajG